MLKDLLNLRGNPVGVRWLRMGDKGRGGTLSAPATFCQAVRMAAFGGWHIHMAPRDMGCKTAQWIFGFREPDEWDVEHHRQMYVSTDEEAKSLVAFKPGFGKGEIQGIEVGPLGDGEGWDVVMVIVDSLQALRLLQAWTFHHQEGVNLSLGSSSLICSFGAISAYKKESLVLTLPCIGAKVYGLYQDHELVCAFPKSLLEEILEGLKETQERGHRIPYVPRFHLPPSPPAEMIKK